MEAVIELGIVISVWVILAWELWLEWIYSGLTGDLPIYTGRKCSWAILAQFTKLVHVNFMKTLFNLNWVLYSLSVFLCFKNPGPEKYGCTWTDINTDQLKEMEVFWYDAVEAGCQLPRQTVGGKKRFKTTTQSL